MASENKSRGVTRLRKKFDDIFIPIWIQHTNMTDRRTDGHRSTFSVAR